MMGLTREPQQQCACPFLRPLIHVHGCSVVVEGIDLMHASNPMSIASMSFFAQKRSIDRSIHPWDCILVLTHVELLAHVMCLLVEKIWLSRSSSNRFVLSHALDTSTCLHTLTVVPN